MRSSNNIVTPSEKRAAEERLRAAQKDQKRVQRNLAEAEDRLLEAGRRGLTEMYDVTEHEVEDIEQIFAAVWQARKALGYGFVHPAKSRWPHAFVGSHQFVFVSSQPTGGIEDTKSPNAFFIAKASLGRVQEGFLALAALPGRLFVVRWEGGKDPGVYTTVEEGPGSFGVRVAEKETTATALGIETVTMASKSFESWREVGEDPQPRRNEKLPVAVLSLLAVQKLVQSMKGVVPLPDSPFPLDAEHKEVMQERLRTAAREARVFQIPTSTVQTVHRSIETWVYAQRGMQPGEDDQIMGTKGPLVGLPQLLPVGVQERDREAGITHVAFVAKLGEHVPFPEQLPFTSCFFGWDQPLLLGPIGCAWRGLRQKNGEQFFSLGMFVFDAPGVGGDPRRGWVVEVGVHPTESGIETLWCCTHRGLGRWGAAGALFPWLTNALVAIVEDCRTFVVESGKRSDKDYHRHLQVAQRKIGVPTHAPRPWYNITLTDTKVIHSFLKASERPWPVGDGERVKLVRIWAHRWDVGAHDRMYVRRGKLPILPAEKRKLEERGYEVWTVGQPEDETLLREMRKRAHPLRQDGEWLAIRLIRIEQYQKGPEDAPYRPAARHVKATLDLP